jgi:hypothetical protein
MRTPPETQPQVSNSTPDTAIEVMLIELYTGIPKPEAHAIRSDAEANLWDRLARQIAATERRAQVVVCDGDE